MNGPSSPPHPQISIPKPSNACFGFDSTTGWTFFDLNELHDEYRDEPGTVVEADFVSDSVDCKQLASLFTTSGHQGVHIYFGCLETRHEWTGQ